MADSLRDRLQSALGSAYTLERELGGGGMSRVFVAEETRFRRRVVIKVLSSELAAELSAERFEREISPAAGLQQANVVPVITAGDVDGLPWYAMPYVEGESLRARLARGPVTAMEAVTILRDVARAPTRTSVASCTATSSPRTSCFEAVRRQAGLVDAGR
jgi:serine/threonine-protein kinase